MPKPIVIPSPNKKHKAILTQIGEIQPVFGRVSMWSAESRFLALQEWKEPGEGNPPKYYLLLIIDVLTRRECVISNIEGIKGNILPEGFIGESLLYTVIYYGQFGITKNFESRFQDLDNWQNLK
jgi:hypothetical protein